MSTIAVLSVISNLVKHLNKVLPNLTFHQVTNPDNDDVFKHSKIIISDLNLLGPHLYSLPETKWVQLTWAGIDFIKPYLKVGRELNYQMTRFSGEHFGRIMSEYIITQIVIKERDIFRIANNQKLSVWARDGAIGEYRTISDLTIGILGLGQIGNYVGKMLKNFGTKILGFGREYKGQYDYLNKFYNYQSLNEFLKNCDYFVNILPNTPETTNLLGNGVLENCKEKKSIFINVGRGNIITESDLIKALDQNWISFAILDVFAEEPLDKTSSLWTNPKIFLTPHVSASSRAHDIAEQFVVNYNLYKNNQTIPTCIDFAKGY